MSMSSGQLHQEAKLHTPQGATGPLPADHWGKGSYKGEMGTCTVSEAGVMEGRCSPECSLRKGSLAGRVEPLQALETLEG